MDVKTFLEYELAARAYDTDGKWIGLSTSTNAGLAKYAGQKVGIA